ncbi:MAG: hypothetical protein AB7T37_12235 [Dehalococcoidia bacterium]
MGPTIALVRFGQDETRRFASFVLAASGVWLCWGSFPFARVAALGLGLLLAGHLLLALAVAAWPRRRTAVLVTVAFVAGWSPWLAWTALLYA